METLNAEKVELRTSSFSQMKSMKSMGAGIAFDEDRKDIYIGGGACEIGVISRSIFKINVWSRNVEEIGEYPYDLCNAKMFLADINGRQCLITFGGIVSTDTDILQRDLFNFLIFDLEKKTLEIKRISNGTKYVESVSFRQGLEFFCSKEDGKNCFTFVTLGERGPDFVTVILKIDISNQKIVEVLDVSHYPNGELSTIGCVIGSDYYTWYGENDNSYLVKLDLKKQERKFELVSERFFKNIAISRSLSYSEKYYIFLPGVEFDSSRTGAMYNPFGNCMCTKIHILNLLNKKWKDVKIQADFTVVRVWPSCCIDDTSLYIFGGATDSNDKSGRMEILDDFLVINLFKEKNEAVLDSNCRIEFLKQYMDDEINDVKGYEHGNLKILLENICIRIRKFFF